MNPALLQHPSSYDLSLSHEAKYIGSSRQYSNLTSFPTNEYQFSQRRTPSDLTHGATLSSNASLDFNHTPLLADGSYHNSGGVLSPPDSINGSSTTNVHNSTSAYPYSKLPNPFSHHATAAEQLSGVSASVLSSAWTDNAMNTLDRSRLNLFPNALSPPLSSIAGNGISVVGLHRVPSTMDPYRFPAHGSYVNGNNVRPIQNSYLPRPGPYGAYTSSGYSCSTDIMPPTSTEGPPFHDTKVQHKISVGRQEFQPEINCSIQKGFFQVDSKWTCYRRNYFTVSCSFTVKNLYREESLYLTIDHALEPILGFAVSISAKTSAASNQDSEPRGLVQHTPKRDKETESVPGRHSVSPAFPQPMHHHSGSFGAPANMYHPLGQGSLPGAFGNFEPGNAQAPPTSYTFERIQFQKATANNGKRRAQQQYFHIVVHLSALIRPRNGREQWVEIATRDSDPVVVRGRSPGHYKDNGRRDSQTSMDRDRGTGGGSSEGSSINFPHSAAHHPSGMDWTYTGRGHHFPHDGSTYRSFVNSENSPLSTSSSTTLTESPEETRFALSESDAMKSIGAFDPDQPRYTPGSEIGDEPLFSLGHITTGRKRPFEDDSAGNSPCHINQTFEDVFNPHGFETTPVVQPKALCAS